MPTKDCQLAAISELGEKIYRERIKSRLAPSEKGKIVAIDVLSGDYEVDADFITASDRLQARRPDAVGYAVRVGYKAVFHIGGSYTRDDD